MGKLGKCPCNCGSVECEPCTEQEDLATWSIEETIFGMSFSGSFPALNETACIKSGCVCERRDNVEIAGEASLASDWTAYVPFLSCGPCYDCDLGVLPPPCAVDPMTLEPLCSPDYPKQVIWDSSARNGVRVKFFWSAGIDFCVTAQYLPGNQIRFVAEMGFAIASMANSSYGLQRRYRRREFFCGYTTPISTETYNDGSLITIPEPIDPCVDLISEWVVGCDPYSPPEVPDPCEESESETVTEAGCQIWNGSACVSVSDSATITIASSVNCCDGNDSGCDPSFDLQRGVRIWTSETYDCDSVPEEIELNINDLEWAMEFTLEFDCDAGWSNTTAPTVFTIPSTLTLTVA
jgi:hypothetical protein